MGAAGPMPSGEAGRRAEARQEAVGWRGGAGEGAARGDRQWRSGAATEQE
jgi:hypothetical protein